MVFGNILLGRIGSSRSRQLTFRGFTMLLEESLAPGSFGEGVCQPFSEPKAV